MHLIVSNLQNKIIFSTVCLSPPFLPNEKKYSDTFSFSHKYTYTYIYINTRTGPPFTHARIHTFSFPHTVQSLDPFSHSKTTYLLLVIPHVSVGSLQKVTLMEINSYGPYLLHFCYLFRYARTYFNYFPSLSSPFYPYIHLSPRRTSSNRPNILPIKSQRKQLCLHGSNIYKPLLTDWLRHNFLLTDTQ